MTVVLGVGGELLDLRQPLLDERLTSREARLGRRRPAASVLAAQQPHGQRKEGHEDHAERVAGGEHLTLGLACEKVVLVLHAGEAAQAAGAGRLVGLGELRRGEVRTADLAHLALGHELVHGGQRVGDGHRGVGPVQQVEVDVLAAQALQALLAGAPDPPRIAARQPFGYLAHAELGGDHDVAAPRAESRAEQRLGGAVGVDVGRVEVRDAGREGGFDDARRPGGVEPPPEVVAAQARRRDLERADPTLLRHGPPSPGDAPPRRDDPVPALLSPRAGPRRHRPPLCGRGRCR